MNYVPDIIASFVYPSCLVKQVLHIVLVYTLPFLETSANCILMSNTTLSAYSVMLRLVHLCIKWVLLSQYFDLSTLQLFLARSNPLRQEETCSYVLFRGRWIWNWSYQTKLYISNNAREVSMYGLVCPKVHTL